MVLWRPTYRLPWWLRGLKHLPAMWETWAWSLGWEDPLEREIATHSSILKSPGWRSWVGYSPWGRKESDTKKKKRVGHDWATSISLWRPTRSSRTNTQKRCPFHHGQLKLKSRKSEILGVTGKFGLGVQNEAEQRLIEFCQENVLVTGNTLFQQQKRRLYTGTSPDDQYWNQIDYIICS